jgi:uncharacterized protein (DUF362 family)/Pyruvate/2-oxoacid:ferredoxin oxidoreductase delta subunit
MMNNTVCVVRCKSYQEIEGKVKELLQLLGGIEKFLSPGDRVALKPNLLRAAHPEKAVTTHPSLVSAVGEVAIAAGGSPFLIDSPTGGYPYTRLALERLYRETGMEEAAREAGVDLNYRTDSQEVSFSEGLLTKHFEILSPLLEADLVINLPKLKTHVFLAMTGAVKNLFGALPGLIKPGYHAKLIEAELFAQMLLDLAACLGPRLTIMDAVVGMEGDGPGGGGSCPIGLLLGAENPLALDVVVGEIMGLPRDSNPLLLEAEKQGRGPTRMEEINLVGLDPAELRVEDFQLPSSVSPETGLRRVSWLQRTFLPLVKGGLTLQPRVIAKDCIACEECLLICPEGVISLRGEEHVHAWIDDQGCIRCYCCHETCPENAIELHKSLLYKLIIG